MNLSIGEVQVATTDFRGSTPEELAQCAIDRIIQVGGKSHPTILAQAQVFKDSIYILLLNSFREAQQSERTTICAKLTHQGLDELASLIRDI